MLHPLLNTPNHVLFGLSPVPGDVGIELEVEGLHLPRTVRGWTRKIENSLRGAGGRPLNAGEDLVDTPQEYVTTGAVSGGDVAGLLTTLYRALTKDPAQVHLTTRASTHIHVNMSRDKLHTAFGFIIIFSMIEPILLRICGPTRNGNLFCMPSYETWDFPQWGRHFASSLVGCTKSSIRHLWPTRGKYASLNIDPMMSLGSLEVRIFPNEIDPTIIHRWVSWLLNIKTLAKDWPDETYASLVDKAYNDPQWLIAEVFREYKVNLFSVCSPQHPAELLHFGCEHAYETQKGLLPIFNFTEKKKSRLSKKGEATLATFGDFLYDDMVQMAPPPVSWSNPFDENEPEEY